MTEDELLRQIAETPFELAPRLVFADFLAERDDPRAEVIVLSTRDSLTGAERRRMKEVEREHAEAWLGPLSAIAARASSTFAFGFLEQLELAFQTPAERLSSLNDEPRLATVRSLDTAAVRHVSAVATFLAQRSFKGLKRLIVGPDTVVALARGPFPFQLETVGVSNAESFDDMLGAFGELQLTRAAPRWEFVSKLLFGTSHALDLFRTLPRYSGALDGHELRLTVPYGVFEGVATWLTRPIENAPLLKGCTAWSVRAPGVEFTLIPSGLEWSTLRVRLEAETMKELDDRVSRLAAVMVLLASARLERIEVDVSSGLSPTRAQQHVLKVAARRLPTASVMMAGAPLVP